MWQNPATGTIAGCWRRRGSSSGTGVGEQACGEIARADAGIAGMRNLVVELLGAGRLDGTCGDTR